MRPPFSFRARLTAGVVALILGHVGGAARAEPLPDYPELQSPFGMNGIFDYSEDQAELQRLDAGGVMTVVEAKDPAYANELGVRHYRARPGEYAGFAWERMDPQRTGTTVDFVRTDALVATAQRLGLNVLPVLGLYRDRAEAAAQGGRYLPRTLDAYGAWVRRVVERYDGDGIEDMPGLRFRIGAWQVGEAPDLLVGLNDGRFATVEDYTRVLEATADAIRAADPRAQVVIGAVSSVYGPRSGLEVLDAVLATSVAAKVDVLSFEYLPRSLSSADLREAVKAITRRAGDRPLWCTLSCSYSRYTPRNAMRDRGSTEETQGADLVRRYAYMLANGVARIYEAGITEAGPDKWKNRTFYSGLRQHDGAPKLAYSSYRLLIRLLAGMDRDASAVLSDGQNDVVVVKFQGINSGALLYVLWWDYAATPEYKSNSLEPDVATQVSLKLTDEAVEVGEMVQTTGGRFKAAALRPRDGELQIPIRRVPVMLRARVAEETPDTPPAQGEPS